METNGTPDLTVKYAIYLMEVLGYSARQILDLTDRSDQAERIIQHAVRLSLKKVEGKKWNRTEHKR